MQNIQKRQINNVSILKCQVNKSTIKTDLNLWQYDFHKISSYNPLDDDDNDDDVDVDVDDDDCCDQGGNKIMRFFMWNLTFNFRFYMLPFCIFYHVRHFHCAKKTRHFHNNVNILVSQSFTSLASLRYSLFSSHENFWLASNLLILFLPWLW